MPKKGLTYKIRALYPEAEGVSIWGSTKENKLHCTKCGRRFSRRAPLAQLCDHVVAYLAREDYIQKHI